MFATALSAGALAALAALALAATVPNTPAPSAPEFAPYVYDDDVAGRIDWTDVTYRFDTVGTRLEEVSGCAPGIVWWGAPIDGPYAGVTVLAGDLDGSGYVVGALECGALDAALELKLRANR